MGNTLSIAACPMLALAARPPIFATGAPPAAPDAPSDAASAAIPAPAEFGGVLRKSTGR